MNPVIIIIPENYLDYISEVFYKALIDSHVLEDSPWHQANDTVKSICKVMANSVCQTYYLLRRDGKQDIY